MSATDERDKLTLVAHDLINELQLVRIEYQKLCVRVNTIVNRCISEADMLRIEAADEKSAGLVPKTKAVRYDKPIQPAEPTEPVDTAPPLQYTGGPRKRNCGICGKPGHRAPTCPNGRKK